MLELEYAPSEETARSGALFGPRTQAFQPLDVAYAFLVFAPHSMATRRPPQCSVQQTRDVQAVRIGLDHQHVHRVARTHLLVFYQPLCGLKRIYGPPIGRREPLR